MKQNKSGQSAQDRHAMVLHHLEGNLSPAENQFVLDQVSRDPEWRDELEKTEAYLHVLRSLPKFTPPDQVWKSIDQKLDRITQTKIWFPWFYSHPFWGQCVKLLPVFLIMIAVFSYSNIFYVEPSYDVVIVNDLNGFGQEAESYQAYSELSGEPIPIRDSVIAFCTESPSK